MLKSLLLTLLMQISIATPPALIIAFFNSVAGISFIVGAAIFVFPQAYFTAYAQMYSASVCPASALHGVIRGEVGKFALAMVLFAVVFVFFEQRNDIALFGGFTSLLLAQCVFGAKISQVLAYETIATVKQSNKRTVIKNKH